MRRLSHRWRSILLERNAFDKRMGTHDVFYRWVVDTSGELDGYTEYQLQWWTIDSQRDLPLERGFRAEPVADSSDVLGCDAGLRAGEHLRVKISRFYQ